MAKHLNDKVGSMEYDKLIDRQLERAAITTISGFAKLFQGASRVLTVKAS